MSSNVQKMQELMTKINQVIKEMGKVEKEMEKVDGKTKEKRDKLSERRKEILVEFEQKDSVIKQEGEKEKVAHAEQLKVLKKEMDEHMKSVSSLAGTKK